MRRIPAVPTMPWMMLRHSLEATTRDNFIRVERAGLRSALPEPEFSRANNNNSSRAPPPLTRLPVENTSSSQLHDDFTTTTSRPAYWQLSLSPNTTILLFSTSFRHNTAIMFKIGPDSSSSGSDPSSRDVSPSKGTEWSTTSENETEPKTPQKRAKSISSSEAYWSDDSDTPVRPRTLRRKGKFYDSPDERSFLESDARSFLASDERSPLSPSDSISQSGSDSGSEEPVSQRSEHPNEQSENELPFEFANAEEWETQHDLRDIDPLKLGKVPVRPLPPVSCFNSIHTLADSKLIVLRSPSTLPSNQPAKLGVYPL